MLTLFGEKHCTRGWERRCAQALSEKCTCDCGGENHGADRPSRERPIIIKKEKHIMTIEVYKPRLGYVAKGVHNGQPYSFAGFTILEAMTKALNFLGFK